MTIFKNTLWLAFFLFLYAVIVASGCGQVSVQQVDPEFTQYVTEFERHYGKYVSSSIQFADIETAGKCNYFSGTIEIDRKYWNASSWQFRESILFHELGHCELELDHSSGIMSELIPLDYATRRDEYISELFDKKN